MTQVAILLFTLVTAPAPAQVGQVVSGPGLRTGQRILSGQVLRAPSKGGPVAVLTTGGCLVHLTGGSRMSLSEPTGKSRCSQVRVLGGRVRLLAPKSKTAGPALTVVLGKHRLTLTGEAFARHDGVSGICVNRGLARHLTATAPSKTVPGATATATPAPRPAPRSAKRRQCLWLTASGATVGKYTKVPALADQKASAVSYGYRTPKVVLPVNLDRELASLSAALHSGSGGDSEVDGGGQSMCLDTGGEGSAADLGSSSVEVSKPPPPTRLRLILKLTRRGL